MSAPTTDWNTFIGSDESASCVITGRTQTGKTHMCIQFSKACMDRRLPVIISCDNRSDQLDQTMSRFQSFFSSDKDVSILRVDHRKFESRFEASLRGARKCVVFLLNNGSQIERLRFTTRAVITGEDPSEDLRLDTVVLIHDEGDVVIKDKRVDRAQPRQPESHKSWIQYCNLISSRYTLKRAFLSATPECVNYIVDASSVISLPITDGYVGYDSIQYYPLQGEDEEEEKEGDDDTILPVLLEQARQMKEGVILYCVDRRIEDGHDTLFTRICQGVHRDIVVHTYNGNGITARVSHPRFTASLQEIIKEQDIKKTKIQTSLTSSQILTIENVPVSEFYEACRRLQLYNIITIGYDLMSRGISFVSSGRAPDTIAATTMFYKPGKTMHAVGLCQAIGRITGLARPDLERKLFAPETVIQRYLAFNKNQEAYIPQLVNSSRTTREEMSTMILPHRMTGPLDRTKLGLKPKFGRRRTPPVDLEVFNRTAREKTRERREQIEKEQERRRSTIAGVNLRTLANDITSNKQLHTVIDLFRENGWKQLTIDAIRKENRGNIEFLDKWVDAQQKGKLFILSDNEQFLDINPELLNHIINC